MSNPPPIPNIPPLSSIRDPATRAVLQALIDGWRVRNGETGDGGEKFLTANDLGAAIVAGKTVPTVVGNGKSATSQAVIQSIAALLADISDSVTNSTTWKTLSERIQAIETPEWFRGKVGAAVKTEIQQLQNSTNALAKQTTTAIAKIAGNQATTQHQLSAVADAVGVSAEAITTLQVDLLGPDGTTGVKAAAEEALTLAGEVDGTVRGAWSVKFDIDGYVAGAGLGVEKKGGQVSSIFLVRADTFAIGTPQAVAAGVSPLVPFTVKTTNTTVGGKTFAPGVYLNTPLYGVSGSFSGELIAATGTFTGTLNAATFSTGNMKTGVKLYDANSGLEVRSTALVNWTPADFDPGANVSTDSSLIFYAPGAHAASPLTRRVSAGDRVLLVTASAVVDAYFSLWTRNSTNGGSTWSAWTHLAFITEAQSGYGPVALSKAADFVCPSGNYALQIGVSPTDAGMGHLDTEVKQLSISATVINW